MKIWFDPNNSATTSDYVWVRTLRGVENWVAAEATVISVPDTKEYEDLAATIKSTKKIKLEKH